MRSADPRRLQRRRRRGWRMPDGAVYVGRPSIWGNPFLVTRSSDFHGLPGSWFVRGADGSIHHPTVDTQSAARRTAAELYGEHVLHDPGAGVSVAMIRSELAGHDLVCWCPDGEPCHADFLLTVANTPATEPVASLTGASELTLGTGCPSCGSPSARVPCPTCGSGGLGPGDA